MTYPEPLPFLTANNGADVLYYDVSGGVQGNTPDAIQVLLNTALTVLPRPPGAPGLPGLVGSAAPGEVAGLVLAAGTTVRLFQPQAAAVVAAGFGTITGT